MILIFYKNGWSLCSEKVKYIQHGEEIIQYVTAEGHDWWVDFEEKWEHTEIIEFIPVEHTEEQLGRFEEINQLNIPEGFSAELGDYVESGVFPDGVNHILKSLQIQKENDNLSNYVLDVDMRLTMQELGL
ncbi:MAG: hypothetical protein PHE79_05125 [Eubacteriales bacterium]|nr:hypothetical protein [Eubacteriales bacterium]